MFTTYTCGKHRKKPFVSGNCLMVLRVKVDGNEQQQWLFTKYSHLPNATGLQKPDPEILGV